MIKPLSYFQTIISLSALNPNWGGQGSVRSVKRSNKRFIFLRGLCVIFPQETLCLYVYCTIFPDLFCLYLMSAKETYHF